MNRRSFFARLTGASALGFSHPRGKGAALLADAPRGQPRTRDVEAPTLPIEAIGLDLYGVPENGRDPILLERWRAQTHSPISVPYAYQCSACGDRLLKLPDLDGLIWPRWSCLRCGRTWFIHVGRATAVEIAFHDGHEAGRS